MTKLALVWSAERAGREIDAIWEKRQAVERKRADYDDTLRAKLIEAKANYDGSFKEFVEKHTHISLTTAKRTLRIADGRGVKGTARREKAFDEPLDDDDFRFDGLVRVDNPWRWTCACGRVNQNFRYRVALHEAGHWVIGHVLGAPVLDIELDVPPDVGLTLVEDHGMARKSYGAVCFADAENTLFDLEIMRAMAGFEAECELAGVRYLTEAWPGDRSDMIQIAQYKRPRKRLAQLRIQTRRLVRNYSRQIVRLARELRRRNRLDEDQARNIVGLQRGCEVSTFRNAKRHGCG